MNGYLVQFHKPLGLRHTLLNKNGIDVFHIRQTDKLIDSSIIAYIAFQIRVSLPPLLCRHTEHSYIQHIGFISIDYARLSRSNLCRNKILLYRIGMYAVIYFRQFTLRRPAQLLLLLCFKPLKLFYYVNLELRTYPHRKLKGDVLVSVCAAISTSFCLNTNRICPRHKFLDTYLETIETGLIFNYGEFAIIKIGIIYFLPNTDIFKRIAVAQPIGYENISVRQI